jgi:hypothetical protein
MEEERKEGNERYEVKERYGVIQRNERNRIVKD